MKWPLLSTAAWGSVLLLVMVEVYFVLKFFGVM